jgi:hypothetical protein
MPFGEQRHHLGAAHLRHDHVREHQVDRASVGAGGASAPSDRWPAAPRPVAAQHAVHHGATARSSSTSSTGFRVPAGTCRAPASRRAATAWPWRGSGS